MMLPPRVIIFLAAVHCGSLRDPAEEKCFNAGLCAPHTEPTGSIEEVCSAYEDSLSCLRLALEACRQLPNQPAEFAAAAERALRELSTELDNYCADISDHTDASHTEKTSVSKTSHTEKTTKVNPVQKSQQHTNQGNAKGAATRVSVHFGSFITIVLAAVFLILPCSVVQRSLL